MLHPHTEIRYISEAMGLGVFATRPIPKGTLLWVLCPLDYGVEIAVRDIAAGEELTCDYSELNLEQALHCACASPACRGNISRSDTELLWQDMDRQVREALLLAPALPQPLLDYARYPATIRRLLANPASLGSHRDFYRAVLPLDQLA